MTTKKPLSFLLLFLGQISLAIAQITIGSQDMPSSGDTLRYSTALSVPASMYEPSGPNQTWNFSSLTPASQDVYSYKSSLQTPYAFFFLGLNKYGLKVADTLGVGAFQFTDVHNFYKKSTQAFEIEGIGLRYQGIPLPAYYTEKDQLYRFPLQYGDRDSTRLKFTISLSTLATYSQVGYRISEVVGWGSVTTPYGTFNCLKMKSSVYSSDSINLSGFPVRFNRRIVEYKWLANGQKIPVMEISGTMVGNTFLPTTIRYRDIKRSNTLLEPPVALFSASPLVANLNQNVTFQNNSTGSFVQYQWTFDPSNGVTFENGTSDTSKNPQVLFSQPGFYSVKLRASNFIGSNEMTKTNYIQVLDPTGVSSRTEALKSLVLGNNRFLIPEWASLSDLSVLDMTGRAIRIRNPEDLAALGRWQKGSILVLTAADAHRVWHKKFIVL